MVQGCRDTSAGPVVLRRKQVWRTSPGHVNAASFFLTHGHTWSVGVASVGLRGEREDGAAADGRDLKLRSIRQDLIWPGFSPLRRQADFTLSLWGERKTENRSLLTVGGVFLVFGFWQLLNGKTVGSARLNVPNESLNKSWVLSAYMWPSAAELPRYTRFEPVFLGSRLLRTRAHRTLSMQLVQLGTVDIVALLRPMDASQLCVWEFNISPFVW